MPAMPGRDVFKHYRSEGRERVKEREGGEFGRVREGVREDDLQRERERERERIRGARPQRLSFLLRPELW